MSGKAQEIKGRVKEAAGVLADDDELRREGKVDKAVGSAKQAMGKVADQASDAMKKLNRKASE